MGRMCPTFKIVFSSHHSAPLWQQYRGDGERGETRAGHAAVRCVFSAKFTGVWESHFIFFSGVKLPTPFDILWYCFIWYWRYLVFVGVLMPLFSRASVYGILVDGSLIILDKCNNYWISTNHEKQHCGYWCFLTFFEVVCNGVYQLETTVVWGGDDLKNVWEISKPDWHPDSL